MIFNQLPKREIMTSISDLKKEAMDLTGEFFHFGHRPLPMAALTIILVICGLLLTPDWGSTYAQTALGEIEARPAPVARRICISGANAGHLCNQNGSCPGSLCVDRNIFNISVAVQFNATNAELTSIQNLISNGSSVLFDVTDGQAEIGEAFIYNNAFGTGTEADLRIYPTTNPMWWQANTGSWQVGGSIHVSMNNVSSAANPGESLAHEFVHLVFDARDEYESRPAGCIDPTGVASCPDDAAGVVSCLMDGGGLGGADHSELCWGQGNPANLTDLTGGNHDATNITEQSRCRSNRSCWNQITWSWPNTFLAPAGAPNNAANGAIVNPTHFVTVNTTMRIVLVLDQSGSMSLESPSRMNRLKVAAKDFIALAENGTELGIVSYSDDAEPATGMANVAIAALGANRTAWNNAIDGLTPTNWTNIGAGLQKAVDMINTAGGVTGNTFIVLMTDGINNRPSPQASADAFLQDRIDDLLALGIPVYVTCTGGDLGLASQCSEIAAGTNGFYVDSRDAARLPEAFVDFHERISHRDGLSSFASWMKLDSNKYRTNRPPNSFFVEEGSESATFTLLWDDTQQKVTMFVTDPSGKEYSSSPLQQGRFVRVTSPVPGEWKMSIDWPRKAPAHYVTRAYSRNQTHSLSAGVRYARVLPGEEIYIYAYPRSTGGSVTDTSKRILGAVICPDGSIDYIELDDLGKLLPGGGDDISNDGVFTGVYRNTKLKGPYQFLLYADIDKWWQSEDRERPDKTTRSPHFVREVRISATVGDPNDVVKNPEDHPHIIKWCMWLFYLVLILILLLIWCIIMRRRQKRSNNK
jgi:Mg-chelatase subunit ChlD